MSPNKLETKLGLECRCLSIPLTRSFLQKHGLCSLPGCTGEQTSGFIPGTTEQECGLCRS